MKIKNDKKPIGHEGSVDSANQKTSYYFSASWEKLMFHSYLDFYTSRPYKRRGHGKSSSLCFFFFDKSGTHVGVFHIDSVDPVSQLSCIMKEKYQKRKQLRNYYSIYSLSREIPNLHNLSFSIILLCSNLPIRLERSRDVLLS